MTTQTCPNCLSSVPEHQQFCTNCGNRLVQTPYGGAYAPPTRPIGSNESAPHASLPQQNQQNQQDQPYSIDQTQPPTTLPPSYTYPSTVQKQRTHWSIIVLGFLGVLFVSTGLIYFLFLNNNQGTMIATLPTSTPQRTTPTMRPTATSLAAVELTTVPTIVIEPTTELINQDILLEDDFSTKAEGWPEGPTNSKSGSYAYVNGNAYQISVDQAQLIIWTSTIAGYGDVEMQIDITARSGPIENAAGLTLREQENGSMYAFQVSPDGTYAFRRFDKDSSTSSGEWISLVEWTFSQAVNQELNSVNRLRIVAIGSTFELYINGQLLDVVVDETYAFGSMGFGVSTFDAGNSVMEFDNLRLIQR